MILHYKLKKDLPGVSSGEIFRQHHTDNHYHFGIYKFSEKEIINNKWFSPYMFTSEDGEDMYLGDFCFSLTYINKIDEVKIESDFFDKMANIRFFSTKHLAYDFYENHLKNDFITALKEKYPIGTKVNTELGSSGIEHIGSHDSFDTNGGIWFKSYSTNIKSSYNTLVYSNGNFAKIIEKPIVQTEDGNFLYSENFIDGGFYEIISGGNNRWIIQINKYYDTSKFKYDINIKSALSTDGSNIFHKFCNSIEIDKIKSIQPVSKENKKWIRACVDKQQFVSRKKILGDEYYLGCVKVKLHENTIKINGITILNTQFINISNILVSIKKYFDKDYMETAFSELKSLEFYSGINLRYEYENKSYAINDDVIGISIEQIIKLSNFLKNK